MIKKLLILLFLCIPLLITAESLLEQGEGLLREQKYTEAEPLFLSTIGQDPSQGKAYIYLSFIYEMQGAREKALGMLKRGLDSAVTSKAQIYYNLGNLLFAEGRYEEAEEQYTQAIALDNRYAGAVLNRGNSRLHQMEFQDTLNDYILYLNLAPQSSQKGQIEQVIGLIREHLQQEEARKLAEEEARIKAEEEAKRLAEEKRKEEERLKQEEAERKRQEEERQQALLADILNSLQNAGENTEGLSAESEGLEEYEYDVDIED